MSGFITPANTRLLKRLSSISTNRRTEMLRFAFSHVLDKEAEILRLKVQFQQMMQATEDDV
jgi:hypothetical protein